MLPWVSLVSLLLWSRHEVIRRCTCMYLWKHGRLATLSNWSHSTMVTLRRQDSIVQATTRRKDGRTTWCYTIAPVHVHPMSSLNEVSSVPESKHVDYRVLLLIRSSTTQERTKHSPDLDGYTHRSLSHARRYCPWHLFVVGLPGLIMYMFLPWPQALCILEIEIRVMLQISENWTERSGLNCGVYLIARR